MNPTGRVSSFGTMPPHVAMMSSMMNAPSRGVPSFNQQQLSMSSQHASLPSFFSSNSRSSSTSFQSWTSSSGSNVFGGALGSESVTTASTTRTVDGHTVQERILRRSDGTVHVERSTGGTAAMVAPPVVRRLSQHPPHTTLPMPIQWLQLHGQTMSWNLLRCGTGLDNDTYHKCHYDRIRQRRRVHVVVATVAKRQQQ